MQLAARLNALRCKRGESLQDVADAVGVSKAHIWELEKGRTANPSFDLVRRLAAHFAVTADVLLGEAEIPAAEDLQLQRLHRDIAELTESDRGVIEDMVRSLRSRRAKEGDGSTDA